MLITKTSKFSGRVHTRDIPVTQSQLDAWKSGGLIQRALHHLSLDDREFLISGVTPEEWSEMMGEADDDFGPLTASEGVF